ARRIITAESVNPPQGCIARNSFAPAPYPCEKNAAMELTNGPSGKRRLARPVVRHEVDGRPLRPARLGLPQLGDGGRRQRPERRRRLSSRARPLPSLRFARLPVGAPDAHFPQTEET